MLLKGNFIRFLFAVSALWAARDGHGQTEGHFPDPSWQEIRERRTADSRTFLDSEGFYHTQQTAGYFHFPGTNGEWIDLQDSLSLHPDQPDWCGIFRTELPIGINLNSGETHFSVDKAGQIEFGRNAKMTYLSEAGIPIADFQGGPVSRGEYDEKGITFRNFFPGIDREQRVEYWELRTNYVLTERPSLPPGTAYVVFSEHYVLPEGWTIDTLEGEGTPQAWKGNLAILNDKGNQVSSISPAAFFDSFQGEDGVKMNGVHSMIGEYSIHPTIHGAEIQMRVPVEWLNTPGLVYPVTIDPNITNTYANTQGVQDWINQFSAGCQATMNLVLPPGPIYQVTNTSTQYTILSKGTIANVGWTTYYAAGFEQRSRVGIGANWSGTQMGFGNSMSFQNVPYNMSNLTIGNGCYPGGTPLTYKWQAYQVFFPVSGNAATTVSGCVTNYHQLVANTWVVTVTYQPYQLDVIATPAAPVICSGSSPGITLSSNPPGASYTWTVSQLGVTGASNGSGNSISQVLNTTGNVQGSVAYTVTPTVPGGCPGNPTIIQVLVNPKYTGPTIIHEMCPGETYSYAGQTYSNGGTYPILFQSAAGCDSTVTLQINIVSTVHVDQQEDICEGDSYSFQGSILTEAGVYETTLVSSGGCDSVITLTLQVNPVYDLQFAAEICTGNSYSFAGSDYVQTGVYPVLLETTAGCDSLVTLDLVVTPPYTDSITVEICDGESYLFNNTDYTDSGFYPAVYETALGCDSIWVLELIVHPVYSTSFSESICEGFSYSFAGTDYDVSGQYPYTFTSVHGCDSVATLNLTVLPVYTVEVDEEICDGNTIQFNGSEYGDEGIYPHLLQTDAGCDSTVILNLTVHPVYATSFGESICQGSSFTFEGTSYSQPGQYFHTYTTPFGCDSVVTLNLEVIPPDPVYYGASICQGDSYILEGVEISFAGDYPVTYQTSSGCDSVAILQLTVYPSFWNAESVNICDGESYQFQGSSYSTEGQYLANYQTIHGCDSIYALDLIVNPIPEVSIGDEYHLCAGESVSLQNDGTQGFYRWNNGSENNQLIVDTEGMYWLQVTTTAGCSDRDTAWVEVHPVPHRVPEQWFSLCPGYDQVVLDAGNEGALFQWNTGALTQTISVEYVGVYKVIIANQAGCMIEDEIYVFEYCEPSIFVPGAFTPNGDGLNDYFLAEGVGIRDFEMIVKDRWGTEVFKTNDIEFGWNGSLRQSDYYVADGVYSWIIRYTVNRKENGLSSEWRELRGHVTMVR